MPLHGCMLWETPSMFPSSKHPKSCYNHPLSLFFLPNCRKLRASMYNPFKTPHKLHIFNLSPSAIFPLQNTKAHWPGICQLQLLSLAPAPLLEAHWSHCVGNGGIKHHFFLEALWRSGSNLFMPNCEPQAAPWDLSWHQNASCPLAAFCRHSYGCAGGVPPTHKCLRNGLRCCQQMLISSTQYRACFYSLLQRCANPDFPMPLLMKEG